MHPWKRLVLQGVGCWILGYLINVAITKLREDSPDFIARVEPLLHEELAAIQKAMQVGVHTVTDADALIASVTQLGKGWCRPWPGRRWRRKSTRRSSGSIGNLQPRSMGAISGSSRRGCSGRVSPQQEG